MMGESEILHGLGGRRRLIKGDPSEEGRKERERGSIRGRLVFYSPDERRNGDGDAGGKAGDSGEDG